MASDLYFDDVTLLLHCDGADSSTSFPDNSNSSHTVTANGGASVQSNQADFDGVNDYLSIPFSQDFNFGIAPFTFEAHVTLDATPSSEWAIIFGRAEYGGAVDYLIGIDASRQVVVYMEDTSETFTSTQTVSLSTKTKIGVTRDASDNLKLWVGNASTTHSFLGSTESTATGDMTIGADQGGNESRLNGQIDEIRITKGVARDLTTEESIPYPDEAATVPTQGTISVVGGTPVYALDKVPIQGQITITGGTPSVVHGFVGQPVQGSILLAGGQPIVVEDIYFDGLIPELWSDFALEQTPSILMSGIFPALESDWEFISGLSFEATMPGFDSTFMVSPAVDFKFDTTFPDLTSDISLSGQYEISFTESLPGLSGDIDLGTNTELSFETKLPDLIGEFTLSIPDSIFFRTQFPDLLSDIAFEDDFSLSAELPGFDSDFVLQTSALTLEGAFPTLSVEMTLYTYSLQFESTMPGLTPGIALEEQPSIAIEATFYLNSEIEFKEVDSLSFETTFPVLEFEGIDNKAVNFSVEFPLLIPDIQFDTPDCTKSFL